MSFFTDPKMFFTQILEEIKFGPLTIFERFRYSRTFLKRFVKVRNRTNTFLPRWFCIFTNFFKNVLEYQNRSKFVRVPYLIKIAMLVKNILGSGKNSFLIFRLLIYIYETPTKKQIFLFLEIESAKQNLRFLPN